MSISLGYTPIYDLPLTGILNAKMHIEWSASSPYVVFNDVNTPYPVVTASKRGEYQVYLSLHDTISTLTCTDRIDTINISFIYCDTGTVSPPFLIPTIWSKANGVYTIPSLPSNSNFTIYNLVGQLIFSNKNYKNNWDTQQLSNGIYLYNLKLLDGKEYKGKIFLY